MSVSEQGRSRQRQRDAAVQLHVARRVRELRLARAMTQEELAGVLGVKRESMSRYESGERAITIPMLLTIAATLDQPVTAFLPAETPRADAGEREPGDGVADVIAMLHARPDFAPSVRDLLAVLGDE